MDYMEFVDYHRSSGADITIGCIAYDEERASDFGLMKIDEGRRVLSFAEKPKGDALAAMKVDTTVLGLTPEEAEKKPFIASMGIYVFKKGVLADMLKEDKTGGKKFMDFGGEIIPFAANNDIKVNAYLFNGYWEDIGTIKSFFEENLKLAQQTAPFEFYDPSSPIYTSPRFLPPAKIEDDCFVEEAIISHGCTVQQSSIRNAVVGLRSHIEKGCTLEVCRLHRARAMLALACCVLHSSRPRICCPGATVCWHRCICLHPLFPALPPSMHMLLFCPFILAPPHMLTPPCIPARPERNGDWC
jgi:glucose-1-phosphate adenylyltransferase